MIYRAFLLDASLLRCVPRCPSLKPLVSVLGALSQYNIHPCDKMRYTSSILAVLASTAFAGDVKARDACTDACSTAYDTCRSKYDANRASCAADYAGCLGFNPFDNSGSLVTPTACVTTTATPAPPAPTSACVTACDAAYDTCRSKPDANRAACAADYAGCLGYNPFESGSLVAPTACVGGPIMSTSAAPNATRPAPPVVPPPADTTKPVQVAGAGNMKPAMALLAGVGAVALL